MEHGDTRTQEATRDAVEFLSVQFETLQTITAQRDEAIKLLHERPSGQRPSGAQGYWQELRKWEKRRDRFLKDLETGASE